MLKLVITTVLALFVTAAIADEANEFPKPATEHELLKKFAGSWVTDSMCTMAPGTPPIKCTGKINSKMLGEFWVLNEMQSEVAGIRFTAMHTVGYDKAKKKYVATWIDSLNDFMWKYDGTVTGNKLVFEAEGPNAAKPGEMMKFRDTYAFVSDGKIQLKSEAFDKGKWTAFMTGTATRQ